MKGSWAFIGSISTAALLLSLMAAADSQLQSGAASAAAGATAHVNFRIIIPKVLSLSVDSSNDRRAGAQTVAIRSNGRSVTLNATVRTPDADGSVSSSHTSTRAVAATHISAATANPPLSGDDLRGHIILSAAARKVIAQDFQCGLDASTPAAPAAAPGRVNVNTGPVVCTASMP
ncbi:MAG: hypothetical protein ACHQDD_01280 [Steroidobacterales bacterium]